jgi:hypothetical protein
MRAESKRYETALRLVQNYHQWSNVQPVHLVFTDGDILAALGAGYCFMADDPAEHYRVTKGLDDLYRAGLIHGDEIRYFPDNAMIVVRRPNCASCKETYDDHMPDGKCLLQATYYHDP